MSSIDTVSDAMKIISASILVLGLLSVVHSAASSGLQIKAAASGTLRSKHKRVQAVVKTAELDQPSSLPTEAPTETFFLIAELSTDQPTAYVSPTEQPTTLQIPTEQPTTLQVPTEQPTTLQVPTEQPSATSESVPETAVPIRKRAGKQFPPSSQPSIIETPTEIPTHQPTSVPTEFPTELPTETPTEEPETATPTEFPTEVPGCLPGTYSTAGICFACPAGTFSGPSAESCTPCKDGYHSSAFSKSCTACSPGYYSSTGSSCLQCASGSFSSRVGSATCTPCPNGSFSPPGASTCSACSAWLVELSKCLSSGSTSCSVKYNSYIASLKLLCTKSCRSAFCPAPLTYYSPTIYPSAAPLRNTSYPTKKPIPPAILRVSQVLFLNPVLQIKSQVVTIYNSPPNASITSS